MPENYITCQDEKGSINISEDVVAAMVRAAITEVDGVAGIATSAGTEMAELLGCPVGTVRSRLHRAREAVAAQLRPLLEVRGLRRR